ncbi:hypothetical protein K9B32_18755 [Rhizobium sp. 3T7]|uniref:MATE family efflux transporter n=1 Tax=Rhizobium sp. 3T7 TaxID=2874922 RepID=UPI001CC99653|nr:MATE family efflux transporter [Rhizobium sp. 3T7]MBZ9792142.1 hypothetical protein [Rhizobium sp. 3T7]
MAGITLVFPVLMLMQTMSNGDIGGGVSSSVARALGANRHADADGLVWHSIVLAGGFGAVFSLAAILCGPVLYRSMGRDWSDTHGSPHLFRNRVRGLDSDLDHGLAVSSPPRRRERSRARVGDCVWSLYPVRVVAAFDFRLGPVSAVGRCRGAAPQSSSITHWRRSCWHIA